MQILLAGGPKAGTPLDVPDHEVQEGLFREVPVITSRQGQTMIDHHLYRLSLIPIVCQCGLTHRIPVFGYMGRKT